MEANPILNYGNQTALTLWKLDLNKFIQITSLENTEKIAHEERAKLLEP